MNSVNANEAAPTKKRGLLIVLILLGLAVLALPFIAQTAANWMAEKKLRAFVASAQLDYNVDWEKVRYGLLSKRLEINGLSVAMDAQNPITVDKVTASNIKNASPLPESADLSLKGIVMPLNERMFGRAFAPLMRMGYAELKGDVDMSVGLGADDVLRIEVKTADIADLGSINASAEIA
jgi:hypothetical protein